MYGGESLKRRAETERGEKRTGGGSSGDGGGEAESFTDEPVLGNFRSCTSRYNRQE